MLSSHTQWEANSQLNNPCLGEQLRTKTYVKYPLSGRKACAAKPKPLSSYTKGEANSQLTNPCLGEQL